MRYRQEKPFLKRAFFIGALRRGNKVPVLSEEEK